MTVRMSDRPSLRRFERRAVIVSTVIVVSVFVAGVSGCFKRWPIVITKGGTGTGVGETLHK